jgi:hypothetical protein
MRRTTGGLALVVAVAVSLGPIASCSDDGPDEGEARLEVDGTATIERQDGGRETVTDDADVATGDTVTLTEGTGTLELGDDAVLEVRAARGDGQDSVLVVGPVPVLEAGDLLVTAPDGFEVSAAETRLSVEGGSARLRHTADVEAAAYDTTVRLDSAGQERTIPALREMQVPALGLPPEQPRPLRYDASDPWDRRFLGEAIDLGERLEALAAGYTQNVDADEARSPSFYKEVLPGLVDEPEFTIDLLDRDRAPGETLVGAAITDLGKRGTFAQRWGSVFAFRDQGAAWGLVALDQGVDRGPLLGAVNDAVEDSPLALGPTSPSRRPGSGTTATSAVPPTTVPSSPTTRPRPSSPSTTVPPDEEEDGLLTPLRPLLDPVGDLLAGLLDGLLGGLFSSGPR